MIEKSRHPKNTIAIRASWITAKEDCQEFKHLFLMFKVEAGDLP